MIRSAALPDVAFDYLSDFDEAGRAARVKLHRSLQVFEPFGGCDSLCLTNPREDLVSGIPSPFWIAVMERDSDCESLRAQRALGRKPVPFAERGDGSFLLRREMHHAAACGKRAMPRVGTLAGSNSLPSLAARETSTCTLHRGTMPARFQP